MMIFAIFPIMQLKIIRLNGKRTLVNIYFVYFVFFTSESISKWIKKTRFQVFCEASFVWWIHCDSTKILIFVMMMNKCVLWNTCSDFGGKKSQVAYISCRLYWMITQKMENNCVKIATSACDSKNTETY